jgi:hypothetical protein
MKTMHGMGIEECVKEAGTPDIAHHHDLIAVKTHVLEGFVKDAGNSFMGATRAKNQGPAFIQ